MANTHFEQPDAVTKRTPEVIGKLKSYYELGQRTLQLSKATTGSHARGVITQLVKETGEKRATVNNCQQLAEM